MKRLVTVVMLGLGGWTVPAAAQSADECPDPTAGLVAVSGTIDIQPAATCSGVNYTIGPVTAMDSSPTTVDNDAEQMPATAAQKTATPVPVPAIEPEPDQSLNVDYNTQQMVRLGELDAMQGKPVNMKYASNLGYMQGYIRGQEKRLKAPGGLGGFGGIRGGATSTGNGFGGFGR